MKRRNFLKMLGISGTGLFFAPALNSLVAEAYGQEGAARKNLMVLTDGNGWTHQSGGSRNAPTLETTVRSPTDWDLPESLTNLEPIKDRVSVLRGLKNSGDTDLHGSGWSTLNGVRGDKLTPSDISLDRYVAKAIGREDAFSSIALGVGTRANRPPICVSSDGPKRPFPAIGSPFTAYEKIFGGGDSAVEGLAAERSLLDGMIEDTQKIEANLAAAEKAKFDQLLGSFRELEQRLARSRKALDGKMLPPKPGADIGAALTDTVLEAHIDIIAAAFAFGLTRVAHLSVLGFNAHNVGWGFLGFGGDAHEQIGHSTNGYDSARATEAYLTTINYKAGLLNRLYQGIVSYSGGDTAAAENTLMMWVNSGGGKHHHGTNHHAMVLVGDAGGRINRGVYHDLESDRPDITKAFHSVARAMDVELDYFGNPEIGNVPLAQITGA